MGVQAAKASGAEAVNRMKAMPTDDDCFGPGTIRGDGRKIHPSHLLQAKTPAESKGTFDVLQALATTPADEAFRPPGEGGGPEPETLTDLVVGQTLRHASRDDVHVLVPRAGLGVLAQGEVLHHLSADRDGAAVRAAQER